MPWNSSAPRKLSTYSNTGRVAWLTEGMIAGSIRMPVENRTTTTIGYQTWYGGTGAFNDEANGGMLTRKPGAAVVAVRRGGGIHVFDTINHLFAISQMITVGSTYWNLGYGREKGEVADDAEGMRNMSNLGGNMAWLLGKLAE